MYRTLKVTIKYKYIKSPTVKKNKILLF